MATMRALRWLILLGIIVASAILSSEASALMIRTDPWGNASSTAYVGAYPPTGTHYLVWIDSSNQCFWYTLGGSSGFSEDIEIFGQGGNDTLIVIRWPETICGFSMTTPNYNGHWVAMFGEAGNDGLVSGLGNTTIMSGGAGHDWIETERANAWLDGGSEDDYLWNGATSGSGGMSHAGDGNDCLWVHSGQSPSTMSCGGGTDQWAGPGTRPADCESTDTTCCAHGCP
jgi:Ca2+-binding RTX toxin-like protein